MPLEAPYPELDELLDMMGEAGQRISEIEASEGAAGNLSIYIGWPLEPRRRFPLMEEIKLPVAVPALAGNTMLMSGSGRRLREIYEEPAAHLGFVVINPDGQTARLYSSPNRRYERLSSEFNSHLAIHNDQVQVNQLAFHAVVHAQPRFLTYLSHIPAYREEEFFNRHLLRWEPELIVNLPEGIGVAPFRVPGTDDLMKVTMESLRKHRIVVWSKHGVVARSDVSIKRAVDRIEYAEAGAHYEYLNLANNNMAEGLTPEEIRAICARWDVNQNIF
jgi:rhamnulose-1-phosphate aldolase